MPNYTITVAHKDVDAFRAAYHELYPNKHIISSRQLLFARTFEVNITEEDYLFLSLKFKFLKYTMKILKPRATEAPNTFWIKYP